MNWKSHRVVKTYFRHRVGDYELVVTRKEAEGQPIGYGWAVLAHGKPGRNGKAPDLEEAKTRAWQAYQLLMQLEALDEAEGS